MGVRACINCTTAFHSVWNVNFLERRILGVWRGNFNEMPTYVQVALHLPISEKFTIVSPDACSDEQQPMLSDGRASSGTERQSQCNLWVLARKCCKRPAKAVLTD
jgi:hypothetical protein